MLERCVLKYAINYGSQTMHLHEILFQAAEHASVLKISLWPCHSDHEDREQVV